MLSCCSRSRLSATGLDDPLARLVSLTSLNLSLNILVILIGLTTLGRIFRLRTIVLRPRVLAILVAFEVVRELVILALLLLLQIVGFVARSFAWETRQLLLRLRDANPTSRLRSWTS